MRNKPFPIIEPQFIVKLLHVLTTMGCCSNRCFLPQPPGLSFLSAVWIPRSNHPFMERENRFSQWFAKYLHHCTSFYRQLLPPGLFMARVRHKLDALHSKCARNIRAPDPGQRAAHERSRPGFRSLLSGQETSDGSAHTHGHENKFLNSLRTLHPLHSPGHGVKSFINWTMNISRI